MPSWSLPRAPRSAQEAIDLARDYAEAVLVPDASARRLAQRSYLEIMAAYPPLKCAELSERLPGIDRFAHAWPPSEDPHRAGSGYRGAGALLTHPQHTQEGPTMTARNSLT